MPTLAQTNKERFHKSQQNSQVHMMLAVVKNKFGVYNTDRQCNKTVKIEQLHDQRQWSKNIEYKTLLVLNNIGKTTIQTLTW
jgi:hypothetical protein